MNKTQPSQKSKEKAYKLFEQATQNVTASGKVTPISAAKPKRKKLNRTIAASLAFVAALGAVFGGSLITTGGGSPLTEPSGAASSANGTAQTETAHQNGFILTANAAEVTRGENSVTVSLDNGFLSCSGDEKTKLTAYNVLFPLQCEGENIDTITYSISNAQFFVHTLNNSDMIVSAVKADKEINAGFHSPKNSDPLGDDYMTEDQYSSFTVKYSNQVSNDVSIDIIGERTLSEEDYTAIFQSGGYDVDAIAEVNKKLLGDACIDITVQYTDGTTETQRITISSEVTYFDDEYKPEYVPAITFALADSAEIGGASVE